MALQKSVGEKVFIYFNVVFMLCMCAIMLYPFINMAAVSVSGAYYVNAGLVSIWPRELNIQAYKEFLQGSIVIGYWNSIQYAALGTVFALFINALTAYSLSEKACLIRKPVMLIIAFTMFFSGGLIPWYMIIKRLGMINTRLGIIITYGVAAFYIIILRTFFQELPDSLKESAFIDGANDFTVFIRIVLPLSKPVLATVALWLIVGSWNSFFVPFILLNDPNKFPLQLVVAAIVRKGLIPIGTVGLSTVTKEEIMRPVAENTYRAAAIMAASLPIIMVYPFLQKYFVKGVMIGSLKE